jgi:hypothetical protein
MPKLTASLENAEQMATLPKTDANNPPLAAHVKEEMTDFSKKTGAPMLMLRFEVDDPKYIGRELPGGYGRWLYIMIGGKRESGQPHDLSRLFNTINALHTEWTCKGCDTTSTKNFLKEKVNGSYHYLCPSCSRRADVAIDGSWVGLQCKLRIDIDKQEGSDNESNTIVAVLPRD